MSEPKTYTIKEFQDEHVAILKAIDSLESDIKNDKRNASKYISNFFDKYLDFVKNHLEKEETLYLFMKKNLPTGHQYDILIKSKEILTNSAIKVIESNKKSDKLLMDIANDFIRSVRDRIQIEENEVIPIAEMYCSDGKIQV